MRVCKAYSSSVSLPPPCLINQVSPLPQIHTPSILNLKPTLDVSGQVLAAPPSPTGTMMFTPRPDEKKKPLLSLPKLHRLLKLLNTHLAKTTAAVGLFRTHAACGSACVSSVSITAPPAAKTSRCVTTTRSVISSGGWSGAE